MSTIAEYRELLGLSFDEDAVFFAEEVEDPTRGPQPVDEDYLKRCDQAAEDLFAAADFVRTRPLDDAQLVCFAALMEGEPADALWESRGMLPLGLWDSRPSSIPPAALVCYMMASYLENAHRPARGEAETVV